MARVFFLTYMYVHGWQVGNGGTLAYHFGQVVRALKTAKQLLKDELLAQPQNLQPELFHIPHICVVCCTFRGSYPTKNWQTYGINEINFNPNFTSICSQTTYERNLQ